MVTWTPKTKEGSAILKHISGLQDLGLLELSTFGTLVVFRGARGPRSRNQSCGMDMLEFL